MGIPTFSTVIPRSKFGLSIMNGKGLLPIDAKVGAVMEAIERQTACLTRLSIHQGSFRNLSESRTVLDPRNSKCTLTSDYSEEQSYSWVAGKDLLSNEEVLVPAHLAGFAWYNVAPGPITGHGSSNGLASGNIREEAICQALCELIERDAWTLADLGAHFLPLVRRRVADPENAESGSDDFEIFPYWKRSTTKPTGSFARQASSLSCMTSPPTWGSRPSWPWSPTTRSPASPWCMAAQGLIRTHALRPDAPSPKSHSHVASTFRQFARI